MELIVKKHSTFRDLPAHKENPFMSKTVITTRQKRTTVVAGIPTIDSVTGEITRTEIRQIIEVDDGQFIKLFTQNAGAFFDLSSTALKAFTVVMVTAQQHIGTDRLWLKYNAEEESKFKFSKQTFYRGLAELIEKQFIAKTSDAHWYYLNPNIFFNGDRAQFVREYRKVSKEKKIATDDRQLTFEALKLESR